MIDRFSELSEVLKNAGSLPKRLFRQAGAGLDRVPPLFRYDKRMAVTRPPCGIGWPGIDGPPGRRACCKTEDTVFLPDAGQFVPPETAASWHRLYGSPHDRTGSRIDRAAYRSLRVTKFPAGRGSDPQSLTGFMPPVYLPEGGSATLSL